MTTVNAIRFNKYMGALIGDESISTSADLNVYAGDKVQIVVPDDIIRKYGTVIAIGATGSCSVGDDIKFRFKNIISNIVDKEIEKTGKWPEKFISYKEISNILFNLICDIKYEKMSNKLKGTYGFSLGDFINSKYENQGKTFDINDKDTINEIIRTMMWKNHTPEGDFIFMNAGVMAGYTDQDGFLITHYDFREGFHYEVQNCYLAEGSGRHSADPNMYSFAEQLLVDQRRDNIDPSEGLIALISAINAACDHEVGVDGYYNIVLIDGKKSNMQRAEEINDDRAYLASLIVRALDNRVIEFKNAHKLINDMMFNKAKFEEIYPLFLKNITNMKLFERKVRKYKYLPRRDY
jgi:hypothetical protein